MGKFSGITQVIFGFLIILGLIYIVIGLFTPPSMFSMMFVRLAERPLDTYSCPIQHSYRLPKDSLMQHLHKVGFKLRVVHREIDGISGEIHNFLG
jgi:hypothetical protein